MGALYSLKAETASASRRLDVALAVIFGGVLFVAITATFLPGLLRLLRLRDAAQHPFTRSVVDIELLYWREALSAVLLAAIFLLAAALLALAIWKAAAHLLSIRLPQLLFRGTTERACYLEFATDLRPPRLLPALWVGLLLFSGIAVALLAFLLAGAALRTFLDYGILVAAIGSGALVLVVFLPQLLHAIRNRHIGNRYSWSTLLRLFEYRLSWVLVGLLLLLVFVRAIVPLGLLGYRASVAALVFAPTEASIEESMDALRRSSQSSPDQGNNRFLLPVLDSLVRQRQQNLSHGLLLLETDGTRTEELILERLRRGVIWLMVLAFAVYFVLPFGFFRRRQAAAYIALFAVAFAFDNVVARAVAWLAGIPVSSSTSVAIVLLIAFAAKITFDRIEDSATGRDASQPTPQRPLRRGARRLRFATGYASEKDHSRMAGAR